MKYSSYFKFIINLSRIHFAQTRIFKLIICLIVLLIFLLSSEIYSQNNIAAKEDSIKIVDKIGRLRVEGNKIVDKNGNPVALHGMSLFWSQYIGKYYNYDCIKWLRDDWKCTVIRAAVGIGLSDDNTGYLKQPDVEFEKACKVIDACIDLGIYVIIDWHDYQADKHTKDAIEFFKKIAKLYVDKPNIIYEIYNEPMKISWSNDVKPYAEAVISNIRAIDPDNLIIVGTTNWSQDVDTASLNPLNFNNSAYVLHFYAATHKQELRDRALTALNNGAAIFVSEFGTCEHTGDGIIDNGELENWMKFMDDHNLSWCNWSIADKDETASALKSGASETGNWADSDLSKSGSIIRKRIRKMNESFFSQIK
jgi:endoglucanase